MPQTWQQNKSLSELDYQYLQASEAARQKQLQQQLENRPDPDRKMLDCARNGKSAASKTGLLMLISTALVGGLELEFSHLAAVPTGQSQRSWGTGGIFSRAVCL